MQTKRITIHRPLKSLAAAVVCGLLLTTLSTPWAAGATDEFIAGSGNSYAQVMRIGPTAGRLSLAPVIGVTLADYTDTVARAEAEAADLAAIGVASPCTDAKVPRLRVTSEDAGADKGKSTTFIGQDGAGIGGLFATATKVPTASSRFRLADFEIPGVMAMNGGESMTSTGLATVKGQQVRRGTADVTINRFMFGPVTLTGLHWNSVQITDAHDHKTLSGSFTIGGANVLGGPLPVSNGDLKSVLGPINTALAPTGFSIAPPVFDNSGGLADVSPLSIQIINSPLGRQFLGPLLAAAEPVRAPLTQQLIPVLKEPAAIVGGNPNDCSQTTAPDLSVGVLLTDLTIGIAAGSSQLHIDLGGTDAYTEGEQFTNPFNFNPPALGSVPAPSRTLFTPGTAGTPAIPGVEATVGSDAGSFAAGNVPRSDKTIPGGKGGIAIAVGLIGLIVVLTLAGADWYWMRARRGA